jgi:predicted RNA-binding Zn-ribbon protein involved in translation (DUF1610 family)
MKDTRNLPIFGTCPECGGNGGDDPDPETYHATPRDTTGNGLELIEYQGRRMCPMCARRLASDEESRIESAKYREDDQFRKSVGVEQV